MLLDIEFGLSVFNDNMLPDNEAFIFKRNIDGTIDNTVLTSYGGAKTQGIVIPSSVITIDEMAFRANTNLTGELIIPDTVVYIKDEAFDYTYIQNVKIGNGIKTIGNLSFGYCSRLESIEIGSSINSINEMAFTNNPKLKSITINKPENSVSGAPWGATNAEIKWIG